MANNPKPIRKRRKRNWSICCFTPPGIESIWFIRKNGTKTTHKSVKTIKKALRIMEGLFNKGANEVHISHLRNRVNRIYK